MVLAAIGPTSSEPDAGLPPLQPPLALQPSTPVAVQLKVVDPPLATLASAAVKDRVGASVSTVTVTEAESLPPSPVHERA